MSDALLIGLTGNIACGKSTVRTMLADLGAATIDADQVYHGLIAPGQSLWHALRQRYGDRIMLPTGEIDRRALGEIVFADPAKLAALDALTHPVVVAEIRRRAATVSAQVVVIDAVKLIESGLAELCDQVWIVTCDSAQQVERLMRRNGLTHAEATARVAAHPGLADRLSRADVTIDNSGALAATRRQVEDEWQALQGRLHKRDRTVIARAQRSDDERNPVNDGH